MARLAMRVASPDWTNQFASCWDTHCRRNSVTGEKDAGASNLAEVTGAKVFAAMLAETTRSSERLDIMRRIRLAAMWMTGNAWSNTTSQRVWTANWPIRAAFKNSAQASTNTSVRWRGSATTRRVAGMPRPSRAWLATTRTISG